MELKELKDKAKVYLQSVPVILATSDGQFFYERNSLDALAHAGGKKENVHRITRLDIDVKESNGDNKSKQTPGEIKLTKRLAELEPFKEFIDISKLNKTTAQTTFDKMLKEGQDALDAAILDAEDKSEEINK